jgi:hypothetical protein
MGSIGVSRSSSTHSNKAKLIERCIDGVADEAAEDALWAKRDFVTSLLKAAFRSSGFQLSCRRGWEFFSTAPCCIGRRPDDVRNRFKVFGVGAPAQGKGGRREVLPRALV